MFGQYFYLPWRLHLLRTLSTVFIDVVMQAPKFLAELIYARLPVSLEETYCSVACETEPRHSGPTHSLRWHSYRDGPRRRPESLHEFCVTESIVTFNVCTNEEELTLIVYYVRRKVTKKEVASSIWKQNLTEMTQLELSSALKVRFAAEPKRNNRKSTKCVIEHSPQIRLQQKERRRVYIGWSCCCVQYYVSVTRCFNCQKFRHIAKHCKMKEKVCGRFEQDSALLKLQRQGQEI